MKKKLLAAALCMAMALAVSACGGKAAESGETTAAGAAQGEAVSESANGTTVVVAMGSGFSTLDPGYVYEKYPPLVINACYENLFKFYTNDGAPEPCLAEDYNFSDGGLTLTVTLKDGITFASGNPMTSADVAFSINRCKNLQSNPSFMCDTIESIETPDDKTVIFHLTQPDSAILSKLTYSSLAILDSAVVKENGGTDAEDASSADTAQDYLNTTSAGSGMYVMTSYIPDQEVVLEKNPNYWGEGTNVDKYIIRIQPDSNTQMMTLSTGDIDVAMNMTDDTMAELEGQENIQLINGATKTLGFVMMNMNEEYGGPVSDPLVQQAIRKALNYANFQTICGEGSVTPYSLIQVGFMGSKGERAADYTNIEEAKELLAEAGYADGFDIDLTVCDLDMEGILLTDLAQLIKSDLAQIGINVNIVAQPWAAGYGDAYRDGTLGFTVMYWGIDYNDPNVQLEFLPGATVGLRAGWTADMDQELAAMYEEAMVATDNDARVAVLEKIQDAMYENGPFIMAVQAPSHIAYNTRLDGVGISDPYALDLTLINIK
ncbi:MAG TPA: ABC transporter substrate-binding protein [Candidatus Lachnoclostridium stercoravium]|uniref:ABC transporter substrate-binding protein n=1 Tax=Candidatus Lachnoclostridium stercoravium TaxID=2838633 RepID=A0A9D2HK45_9FIRM|nr:ABC transporter substrate-binding protein [Candidatus Lachnoclostridium stercoravium]